MTTAFCFTEINSTRFKFSISSGLQHNAQARRAHADLCLIYKFNSWFELMFNGPINNVCHSQREEERK